MSGGRQQRRQQRVSPEAFEFREKTAYVGASFSVSRRNLPISAQVFVGGWPHKCIGVRNAAVS
jgi:hypothetical protein